MGQNNTAFAINGFSYADCKATFNGIELPGVTSFDFKKMKAKSNNYGMGENPVSRSRKNAEYEASMDMDYDTQKILSQLSPTGLLTEIPSGIMILSLAKADGGKEIITLPFFEFQSHGINGSQGDDNLTGSIDCIFGGYQQQSL